MRLSMGCGSVRSRWTWAKLGGSSPLRSVTKRNKTNWESAKAYEAAKSARKTPGAHTRNSSVTKGTSDNLMTKGQFVCSMKMSNTTQIRCLSQSSANFACKKESTSVVTRALTTCRSSYLKNRLVNSSRTQPWSSKPWRQFWMREKSFPIYTGGIGKARSTVKSNFSPTCHSFCTRMYLRWVTHALSKHSWRRTLS